MTDPSSQNRLPAFTNGKQGSTSGWLGALALLAVVVMMLTDCSPAWADGDPASDVLLSQVAFLPSDAGFSAAQQAQLTGLLRAAAQAGYPIRVAIIPDSYDLGSITVLWHKPETYARFLAAELSLVYKHPVVVVMPSGLGLNWPEHSTATAQRLLAGITVKPGSSGLLTAADTAVQRLLSSAHAQLGRPVATASASKSSQGKSATGAAPGGGVQLVLIVIAALATLTAVVLIAHRRRSTGAQPAQPGHAAETPSKATRLRPVLMLPAVIVVLGLATAAPILAVSLLRHQHATASQRQASVGTPYTLPEGRRRAPNFSLRDQNGHHFTLAAYHGRAVLVTFVDPLCRNLCPLEAHVLNALVHQLPPAQRPEIIAVSVDVYADARHNLLQDFKRWSLVPQWRWGVGTHKQLAAIWKRYAIGVQIVNKTLAGTTVHYITHTEASYLIDPAGYERALFAWPFSPQDVLSTLGTITRS